MVVSSDAGSVVMWMVISLVVTWLIIYTAVRVGVGHALDRDRPRFVAEATPTAAHVNFVLRNTGTGPALDLRVRWSDGAPQDQLAWTPLLAAGAGVQWNVTSPAVPGEAMVVRTLEASWAFNQDPTAGRGSARVLVLVPSRLNSAG
jgi:hypothetical protein